MTREEKVKVLNDFCNNNEEDCGLCVLKEFCGMCDGYFEKLDIDKLDRAYNDWFTHLVSKSQKMQQEKTDNVNHPAHYTAGGIECIDALKAATVDLTGIEAVCTANAIKYLWRWKHKNGTEDLEKAKWYIDRLLDERSLSNGREK